MTHFLATSKLMSLALGLLLTTPNASAPALQVGTLTGTLLEQTSQQPLGYVRVALVRTTDNAVVASQRVAADGTFSLANVPAGEYQLRTDLLGYEQLNQRLTFKPAPQPQHLAPVQVAPLPGQQIVVTPESGLHASL